MDAWEAGRGGRRLGLRLGRRREGRGMVGGEGGRGGGGVVDGERRVKPLASAAVALGRVGVWWASRCGRVL